MADSFPTRCPRCRSRFRYRVRSYVAKYFKRWRAFFAWVQAPPELDCSIGRYVHARITLLQCRQCRCAQAHVPRRLRSTEQVRLATEVLRRVGR
jgi:hypothetical protein